MAGEPRKPRIRPRRIIERPHLIRALDRSDARVRLIVAGPGYGKTTLAEQWAARDGLTVGGSARAARRRTSLSSLAVWSPLPIPWFPGPVDASSNGSP